MMKSLPSFMKRCLAWVLVVALFVSTSNLGLMLPVSFAESGAMTTVTLGDLLVKNYEDLSDAEKDLLTSGLLTGGSYTYATPGAADELIAVDKDAKSITAKSYATNGLTWVPTTAYVVVGDEVKNTVSLNNGKGVYTYDGNAFSVKVAYTLDVTVDADTQKLLLGASGDLKQGTDNVAAIVTSNSEQIGTITTAIPFLIQLNTGVEIDLGFATAKVAYAGEAAKTATAALNTQLNTNASKKLDLTDMVTAYNAAESKLTWLMENGTALKAKVQETYNYIKDIYEDDLLDDNQYFWSGLQSANPLYYMAFSSAYAKMGEFLTAMEPVLADDWTALNGPFFKEGMTAADYAKLDATVAALTDVVDVDTLTIQNPLHVADATITYNMSMWNVNVTVQLKGVEDADDSAALTVYETKSTTITLVEGASAQDILDAIAKDGLQNAAESEWTAKYNLSHFDVTKTADSDLPSALVKDIEYVITYAPKTYTVTTQVNGEAAAIGTIPAEVPYGYRVTLPVNGSADTVYDYAVNGAYYAEGSVVTVIGDTTINQTAGKPYVGTTLNAVISQNYSEDGEPVWEVLTSGALTTGNDAINVRYPDNDNGTLVQFDGETITAHSYPASYNNLVWVPYSYTFDGDAARVNYFTGNGAPWTATINEASYNYIDVVYRLALTNFDEVTVLDQLNLPATLRDEAADQKKVLDTLSGYTGDMGQLNYTMLDVLKTLIKNTTMHEDADRDAQLKALFTNAVDSIMAQCLDADNNLKLYNLLTVYGDANNGGLAYYYKNSAAFLKEVDILSGFLSDMVTDEDETAQAEKRAALKALLESAGKGTYADKIEKLEAAMASVKANLTAPNAVIDVNSANLNKLVEALEMTGTASSYTKLPSALVLTSDVFTLDAPDKTSLQITVQIANGKSATYTVPFNVGDVLTADDVATIKTEVAKLIAGLNVNDKYYTTDYADAKLDALVGTTIELGKKYTYTYTWTLKEFTVKVEGAADQIVTLEDRTIQLPASPDAAVRYDYIINGQVCNGQYTFKAEELDTLFVNGELTISRVVVDVQRESLIKFVNNLNDKVGSDAIVFALTENANGEYAIVMRVNAAETKALASAAQGMAMGLVQSGYSYIGMDNNALLTGGTVSLQAIVDAVMTSGFGTQTIVDVMDQSGVINNMTIPGTILSNKNPLNPVGGKLVETTMQLGNNAEDAYELPMYITLGSTPAQLVEVRNLLAGKLGSYIKAECTDGRINIDLTMPEKAYEYYLATLLVTDNIDLTDIGSVNQKIALGFAKDLLAPLMQEEISLDTYLNTLDKLGYEISVSDQNRTYFTKVYEILRGFYKTGTIEDDNSPLVMTSVVSIKEALDSLNAGDLVKIIAEYETGLELTVAVDLTNIGTAYEALYVDVNASGITNKAGFTKDLAAKLDTLAGTSVIVLMNDVEGNLVFDQKAILNLNGYTINGNVTANATVVIVDSTLSADACGGVKNGTISGNATILAGAYEQDVTAFLKPGYTQNAAGVVSNDFYTLTKDANGNIEVGINAGILTIDTMPNVRSLVIDLIADLLFNGYTSSKLYVDGNKIYEVSVEDLLALYNSSNKLDEAFNLLTGAFDSAELGALINTVIADVTDFGALQSAIENDTALVTYPMATAPWTIIVRNNTEGGYITVDVLPGLETERMVSVKVYGSDEDKALLAKLMGILDETTVVDAGVDLSQSVADKTLTLDWKANGSAVVDLSKPKYSVALCVMLADGIGAPNNAALVNGIKAYYENGTFTELQKAFDALTTSQVITALKNVSKTATLTDMLVNLGLTDVVSAEVKDLEDVFNAVTRPAAAVLRKLGLSGGNRTLGTFFKDGVYFADKENYSRSFNVGPYKGYSAVLNATITEVAVTVKLFSEEIFAVEVLDANGDSIWTGNDLNAAFAKVEDGYTIQINDTVSLTGDVELAGNVAIVGADKIEVNSYVIKLTATTAKLTADADIAAMVVSGVDGYKVVVNGTYEYTLEQEIVNTIFVTNANGEELYAGNDLNAAFAAAADGCTVEIKDTAALTADVNISNKITIKGADKITLGEYKLYLVNKDASITTDADIQSIVAADLKGYDLAVDANDNGYTYSLYRIKTIFVKDANGNELYSGFDLNAAFATAVDGSTIEIKESASLTADASVTGNITVVGAQNIVADGNSIVLASENAVLAADADLGTVVVSGVDGYKVVADGYTYKLEKEAEVVVNTIFVTNANGEELYAGNDLNAAFAVIVDGCTIEIKESATLTDNVSVTGTITIKGADKIVADGKTIVLASENATVIADADLSAVVVSGVDGYKVVADGYTYKLEKEVVILDPSFVEGTGKPTVTLSEKILNAKVDTDNRIIYLDIHRAGITYDELIAAVNLETENADKVDVEILNSVEELVSNESTLKAVASNSVSEKTAEVTYTIIVLGDVNCNGKITTCDARLVLQYAVEKIGESDLAMSAANVNTDSVVNTTDSRLILQKTVDKLDKFPLD